LRMDMAQFRDLAAFAQFGSGLDKATQQQLERGTRLVEILKQPQYEPMSLDRQVMILFAGTTGYADHVPVGRVREWETAFLRFMDTQYSSIGRSIIAEKRITDENEKALRAAIEEFARVWS
jgi:F-type H+-transporting ATPase subunit alpha